MKQFVPGPFFPIEVKFVQRLALTKASGDGDRNLRGLYDANKNKIFVLRGMSQQEQLHTLLHEMVHAAKFQSLGVADEEAQTDAMARWISELGGFKTLGDLNVSRRY